MKITKLKILLAVILFVLTPIMVVMFFPIPLIYLIGSLDQPNFLVEDLSHALSWGIIPQLILGIALSIYFANSISNKYYTHKSKLSKQKAVIYLFLNFLLFLVLYFIIMSLTAELFGLGRSI